MKELLNLIVKTHWGSSSAPLSLSQLSTLIQRNINPDIDHFNHKEEFLSHVFKTLLLSLQDEVKNGELIEKIKRIERMVPNYEQYSLILLRDIGIYFLFKKFIRIGDFEKRRYLWRFLTMYFVGGGCWNYAKVDLLFFFKKKTEQIFFF